MGGGALHAVEQPADGVDAAAVRGDVPAGVGVEPDPVYYPNGISDAIFARAEHLRVGDAFLYVTSGMRLGFRRRGRFGCPAVLR